MRLLFLTLSLIFPFMLMAQENAMSLQECIRDKVRKRSLMGNYSLTSCCC
jgi:hypothetical protein